MRVEMRERFGRFILWLSLAFVGATWFSWVWASLTGRTFLAAYQIGTPNPIADPARELRIAVLTTVIVAPFALWGMMLRKRQQGTTPR